MRVRRSAALGLTVLAGACASASGDPEPVSRGVVEQPVTVSGADNAPYARVIITREDFVSRAELIAPRADAWEAVPTAFEDVGLPRPAMDRSTWTARIRGRLVRRRLGDERLSSYLDCGRDIGGEYADRYSVRLDVTVELRESGPDATAVLTRVEATGQRTDGTGGTVRCNSRGTLEERLITTLQFRLVAPES